MSYSDQEISDLLHDLGENYTVDVIKKGISVELEHGTKNIEYNITGDDLELTILIVLAHLKEFPDYYSRLDILERSDFWSKNTDLYHINIGIDIMDNGDVSGSIIDNVAKIGVFNNDAPIFITHRDDIVPSGYDIMMFFSRHNDMIVLTDFGYWIIRCGTDPLPYTKAGFFCSYVSAIGKMFDDGTGPFFGNYHVEIPKYIYLIENVDVDIVKTDENWDIINNGNFVMLELIPWT